MGENDDKRWYTIRETLDYLDTQESTLSSKMRILNIEVRALPGSKQDYISAEDVETLRRNLSGDTSMM